MQISKNLIYPYFLKNNHEESHDKMELEDETAIMMGKRLALILTISGHHCIPLD